MKKAVLLKLLILTNVVTFASAETADTVGLNGKIYTVNPEPAWATAVAIKGRLVLPGLAWSRVTSIRC